MQEWIHANMKSGRSKSERRKFPRSTRGFIIDYQRIDDETEYFARRAASVNISAQGLCISSDYEEQLHSVLLITLPHVSPNPGIVAAKIRHMEKSSKDGYTYGLYVLPLFHERFSVVKEITFENEIIDLRLEPDEIEALRRISGSGARLGAVTEGICRFWNDINPTLDSHVGSFEGLVECLKRELMKRNGSGR
jgi:hypothetical protein